MMNYKSYVLLALLAAFFRIAPAQAAESYDNCTGFITSLPAVITAQGTWCFNKDLNTAISSGNAITINNNNVTLDCNNFKLGGLSAGLGTSAMGIYALSRSNVTVRRCNVRGFLRGINIVGISSTGGHLIEDNSLDGNTSVGIKAEGDGTMVRRNRVVNTGGSTVNALVREGISTAYSVDISDNLVSGVSAASGSNGSAVGIYTTSSQNGRVYRNGVSGLLPDGEGFAFGIVNDANGRVIMRDNDIVAYTGTNGYALSCADGKGRARDNVVSGFSTSIVTCGDAGGNDATP